jgi:hypothetical protein
MARSLRFTGSQCHDLLVAAVGRQRETSYSSGVSRPARSSSCCPAAMASSASTAAAASTSSAETSWCERSVMGRARVCRGAPGRTRRNFSDRSTPSAGLRRCDRPGDRFRPLSRRTARLADRHECRHLAAVNGAAHLGSKVSRAVLTSSVTRRVGCGEPLTHPAE